MGIVTRICIYLNSTESIMAPSSCVESRDISIASNNTYTKLANAPTTYTDAIYRPTNAAFIRNPNQFSHPYNVLYPVRNVATFEQPIEWRLEKAESQDYSSSTSSSSGSLSFDFSRGVNSSASVTPGSVQVKKKKGCCGGAKASPKPVVTATETVEKKPKKSMCGGSKNSTTVPTEQSAPPSAKRSKKACCGGKKAGAPAEPVVEHNIGKQSTRTTSDRGTSSQGSYLNTMKRSPMQM